MQFAILGFGAIGKLLHWQFQRAKLNVSVIAKAQQALPNTYELIDTNGVHHSAHVKPAHIPSIDCLIVCTKAYQVVDALKPLIEQLPSSSSIVLCHNGLGPHIEVCELLGAEQSLLLATTTHGALTKSSTQVIHSGLGTTKLGQISGSPLAPLLERQLLAGFGAERLTDDVLSAVWQKLVINCAINPLTAIHRVANGELLDKRFNADIAAIVAEVCQVARADGITLDPQASLEKVYQVITATASNTSSMAQDVIAGRPTEISAINGYVCQRGTLLGVTTPNNDKMVQWVVNATR
ncbi:ketopantoate reductase family protein [Paraferrimonas haliotis]|uniref:2-dehydropantoate 2-reductase n=1 Tax=Paraferrimonas haliotis TaxID=2013866 RepID=A0AA37TTQ5_9GAMM|nr:2-dehydropantoate 2-reductase [Paraferrimonas haliotis]GLS82779.1 2-dehydropantoate 2-reductase [Paraferrimonas haliotis]